MRLGSTWSGHDSPQLTTAFDLSDLLPWILLDLVVRSLRGNSLHARMTSTIASLNVVVVWKRHIGLPSPSIPRSKLLARWFLLHYLVQKLEITLDPFDHIFLLLKVLKLIDDLRFYLIIALIS